MREESLGNIETLYGSDEDPKVSRRDAGHRSDIRHSHLGADRSAGARMRKGRIKAKVDMTPWRSNSIE